MDDHHVYLSMHLSIMPQICIEKNWATKYSQPEGAFGPGKVKNHFCGCSKKSWRPTTIINNKLSIDCSIVLGQTVGNGCWKITLCTERQGLYVEGNKKKNNLRTS
jgi:hypothetical protein